MGAAVGTTTAVACALAGLGVVSLIAGQLANSGVSVVILATVG